MLDETTTLKFPPSFPQGRPRAGGRPRGARRPHVGLHLAADAARQQAGRRRSRPLLRGTPDARGAHLRQRPAVDTL